MEETSEAMARRESLVRSMPDETESKTEEIEALED